MIRADGAGESFVFSQFCIAVAKDVWDAFVAAADPQRPGQRRAPTSGPGRRSRTGRRTGAGPSPALVRRRHRERRGRRGRPGRTRSPTSRPGTPRSGASRSRRCRTPPGVFTQPDEDNVTVALGYATGRGDGTFNLNFTGPDPRAYFPSTYSYVLAQTTGFDRREGRGARPVPLLRGEHRAGDRPAAPLRAALDAAGATSRSTPSAQIPGAPPPNQCFVAGRRPRRRRCRASPAGAARAARPARAAATSATPAAAAAAGAAGPAGAGRGRSGAEGRGAEGQPRRGRRRSTPSSPRPRPGSSPRQRAGRHDLDPADRRAAWPRGSRRSIGVRRRSRHESARGRRLRRAELVGVRARRLRRAAWLAATTVRLRDRGQGEPAAQGRGVVGCVPRAADLAERSGRQPRRRSTSSYAAHGSFLGRQDLLAGNIDFVLSGVPFTPGRAREGQRRRGRCHRRAGPGQLAGVPAPAPGAGRLLDASRCCCDPDDPNIPDPTKCVVKTPYTGRGQGSEPQPRRDAR